MKRSSWSRVGDLLGRWIRLLACLSGAPELVSAVGLHGIADQPVQKTPPDLDVQLQEILECVWREERMWSLERRIHVPVGKTRYQEGRCVARLERTR
jgi:hypothetical protein